MSAPNPIKPMSVSELAELLVKHHGLHEGLFDTAIEFQFALGAVGQDPGNPMPGVMIGVSRIGLAKAEKAGPHTIDAAKVNPAKKPRKKPQD